MQCGRKVRHKTFVYPREAAALLACEAVPLDWREAHALAAYTYLRPGELRVLTWADVDLDGGFVSVTKAWDYEAAAVKPPKTRNGVRRVPVEPALAPLLRRMSTGRTATELVAPVLSTVMGLGVDRMMRRAGHDVVQTTMGYVKLAEDMTASSASRSVRFRNVSWTGLDRPMANPLAKNASNPSES